MTEEDKERDDALAVRYPLNLKRKQKIGFAIGFAAGFLLWLFGGVIPSLHPVRYRTPSGSSQPAASNRLITPVNTSK